MSSPAPNFLKVEGHDNYVRDISTGAIINTNKVGLTEYQKIVADRKAKEEELNTLKSEVSEIKALLLQLLNKDQ